MRADQIHPSILLDLLMDGPFWQTGKYLFTHQVRYGFKRRRVVVHIDSLRELVNQGVAVESLSVGQTAKGQLRMFKTVKHVLDSDKPFRHKRCRAET